MKKNMNTHPVKYLFYAMLLLLAFTFQSCGDDNKKEDEEDKIDWNESADASTGALTKLFWNEQANFFNYDSSGKTDFHYWPQAHGLDVLIDAYLRTNDHQYKKYFEQWFEGVKAKNGNTWRNDFYDDMEWNALAILRAYQATKETKYKDAVLEIWAYIKEGWNEKGGGGITWKIGEPSKNACSNGPACILAARLYQEFGNEGDKEWALRIYNWQKNTLVNMSNGMVYDNINTQTGEIQKSWIFTYNQGTFLGSAVELYKILGEQIYLNDATLVATYTISVLTQNSVLKNEGTGDGGLFKGIFIRYFTELIRQKNLEAPTVKRYIQSMKYNAETLWNKGTTKPSILFGPDWQQKPANTTGLTEQLSGCMLIEAMALLEKEGYLQ